MSDYHSHPPTSSHDDNDDRPDEHRDGRGNHDREGPDDHREGPNEDHKPNDRESGQRDGQDDDNAAVAALTGMPPGPELGVALARLDLTRVSTHDLVTVVQAIERQKAHTDATQARALAELARRPEYQRCTHPTDTDKPHVHRAVETAGDEVSLALRWTPRWAMNQVATAAELVEVFPATLAALSAGRIDASRARLIVERTRCLTTQLRRKVESVVLPVAEERTWQRLDYRIRQEILAADPDGAEQRRKNAKKGRRVDPPAPASPGGEDGMAQMNLYGPAEDLTALWIALDAAARHTRERNQATGNGDERTLDQLRFDHLTGLGWTGLDTGHLGCCNPTCTTTSSATANGHAPASAPAAAFHTAGASPSTGTGTGASTGTGTGGGATSGPASPSAPPARGSRPGSGPGSETTSPPPTPLAPAPVGSAAASAGGSEPAPPGGPAARAGEVVLRLGKRRGKPATVNVTVPISTLAGADNQPGWLDGYGPITADATRQITAKGTLRRMLTDPVDGKLLEYGRTTYAPPAELAAFVVARDRTCRFPTCTRPASEAEIDHKQPFNQGGTTGAANTWALHKGHHLGKTNHGFTIHTDDDGVTWWTTPAGHTYKVEPEIIGPVLTSPNLTRVPGPDSPDDSSADEPEPAPF